MWHYLNDSLKLWIEEGAGARVSTILTIFISLNFYPHLHWKENRRLGTTGGGGHCFTMKCLRGYWIDIHWFFPTNIDCGVSQVWRSKKGVWRFSWYLQISLMWMCLCTNLEKWYKMLDSQEMIRRWLCWKGMSISRQWIHQRKQGKKFHVWLISLNER